MNLKKYIVLSIVLITTSIYAEQSVYSDSDFVDAETIAKKNATEIFLLKQKISQLQEKIDGFKSIINAQQNEIMQLKQKSKNNYAEILNQLSQRIAKLESKESVAIAKSNILSQTQNESKKQESKEEKTKKKEESKIDTKVSSNELFKKSVLNFTKKRLTKAQKGFKELIVRGYKKASSNFYLGEIAFSKKRYKDAIKYYQNSATLNENASYMDKLLLHTAISLKKIGKTKQAKQFFMAIVDSYPDSPSAKEAQKYLK